MGVQDRDWYWEDHRARLRRSSMRGSGSGSGSGGPIWSDVALNVTLLVLFLGIALYWGAALAHYKPWLDISELKARNPQTGHIWSYLPASADQDAICAVDISSRTKTADTLVAFQSPVNRRTQMAVYVRSGGVASIRIPCGHYAISFAQGIQWKSSRALFGQKTRLIEARDTMQFGLEDDPGSFVFNRVEVTVPSEISKGFTWEPLQKQSALFLLLAKRRR